MASSSTLLRPITSLLASTSKSLPLTSLRARCGPRCPLPLSRSMATAAPGPLAHILRGVDGFLPKESFDTIQEWQSGLWTRLEAEMSTQPALVGWQNDRRNQEFNITDLLSFTARHPELALAFNYASLILNTSFFLEGLSATRKPVLSEFKSLEEQVVGKAKGMTGSGFLWLVKAQSSLSTDRSTSYLDVLPTFSSGTLLVRSHLQLGRDADTPLFDPSPSTRSPVISGLANAGSSRREGTAATPPKGTITPLACLSLFEHAYVGAGRYGVWGREEYARDWFRGLDWDKVEAKMH